MVSFSEAVSHLTCLGNRPDRECKFLIDLQRFKLSIQGN